MSSPTTPAGALPEVVRTILTALMVILTGLAFAGIFAWAMYQTWAASPGLPPEYSEALLYVATAVAALVGGIVAVSFGLKPPQDGATSRLKRNLKGLSSIPGAPTAVVLQPALLSAYALVYIVWGAAAIATWIFRSPETPDIVKNLATTFLGMVIPIVGAFFSQ